MDIFGNKECMNLPQIIYKNILSSAYFKGLKSKNRYHEVVDEIFYHVKFGSPYTGEHVSSLFCLLFKLFTLKLTENQLNGLLNHVDSPFIRIAGFLYIRFATNPKHFLSFFEGLFDNFTSEYLDDPEEVEIEKGVTITIGKFCRSLLAEERYMGLLLPRIPVVIKKDIDQKIKTGYKNLGLSTSDTIDNKGDKSTSISVRENEVGRNPSRFGDTSREERGRGQLHREINRDEGRNEYRHTSNSKKDSEFHRDRNQDDGKYQDRSKYKDIDLSILRRSRSPTPVVKESFPVTLAIKEIEIPVIDEEKKSRIETEHKEKMKMLKARYG
jgi:pre-mRNA-splicing factor 38B